MSSTAECAGQRQPSSVISRFFAWIIRAVAKPRRLIVVDPAFFTPHQLRDIGLLDGHGGSLRRPERTGDRYRDGI